MYLHTCALIEGRAWALWYRVQQLQK